MRKELNEMSLEMKKTSQFTVASNDKINVLADILSKAVEKENDSK